MGEVGRRMAAVLRHEEPDSMLSDASIKLENLALKMEETVPALLDAALFS
jgi:hypothetical protein